MKRWREIPVSPRHEYRAIGGTCDRCGEDATLRGGGEAPVWGEVAVTLQGVGAVYADLCYNCGVELVAWVNAGQGGGARDGTQVANDAVEMAER